MDFSPGPIWGGSKEAVHVAGAKRSVAGCERMSCSGSVMDAVWALADPKAAIPDIHPNAASQMRLNGLIKKSARIVLSPDALGTVPWFTHFGLPVLSQWQRLAVGLECVEQFPGFFGGQV